MSKQASSSDLWVHHEGYSVWDKALDLAETYPTTLQDLKIGLVSKNLI